MTSILVTSVRSYNAGDLIRGALKEILVLGVQDTMTDAEMQDGLDGLNELLDSWSLESLMVPYLTQENFALTTGIGSYTIGVGATFNTTRPLRISQAFVRYSNTDFPLEVIGRAQYDRLGYKGVTSMPRMLFYDPGYPMGTIYLYPVPYAQPYTLYIDSYKLLQEFPTLGTEVQLPPGYARAIRKNLALELAPQYNKEKIPAVLAQQAATAKGAIKRLNRRDFPVYVDSALRVRGSQYDIISDNYR